MENVRDLAFESFSSSAAIQADSWALILVFGAGRPRWRALGRRDGNTVTWFWIGSHAEYDRLID